MMTQIIQAFDNFTFTRECVFEILKDFLAPFKIYLDLKKLKDQPKVAEMCFTCPKAGTPIQFTVACDVAAMPTLKVVTEAEKLLELEFKRDILVVTRPDTPDDAPADFTLLKLWREVVDWLTVTVQRYMLRVAPCARA
ncbi:MAG: hypothetical protein EON60_04770 [Alphaproteobacteria bacterium]|nr:MAG: hypothetical protein EON60_04770 [Alphaproteobacteria bacterium]